MILEVKKVRIFVFPKYENKLLEIIQKNELLMLSDNKVTNNSSSSSELLKRIETAILYFKKEYKNSLFNKSTEIDISDFDKTLKTKLSLLDSFESSYFKKIELQQRIAEINEIISKNEPFSFLDVSFLDFEKSTLFDTYFGFSKQLGTGFENQIFEKGLYLRAKEVDNQALVLMFLKGNTNQVKTFLESIEFEETTLYKSAKTPSQLVNDLNRELVILKSDLNQENTFLKELFSQKKDFEILYDYVYNQVLRSEVVYNKTDKTSYLDGYVRSDQIAFLKETLEKEISSVSVELLDTSENEVVPTAVKSQKFVKPFEIITNMFSPPNSKEADPNPLMAFWYWLIFGIMMGDIGYGFIMTFGSLLFIKKMHPKKGLESLLKIFMLSGITTMIAGFIFGSVFGAEVDFISYIGKLFNQNWQSLNPVKMPLEMLIFSLVLGAIHLICALFMKIINSFKQKDYLSGIADGLSWILVLVGIMSLFLPSKILGIILIAIGVLLIISLAGRNKKKIMGKVVSGLGGLYNVTGYLSDILSYSRILALSLSSAVIGSTMNMLAGLIQGNVLGFIFSILIYIVGHVFNFVMGMLSAYVHDGRLQYIEFFGKFYNGGGKEYVPFSFELKYIDKISKAK